MKLIFKKFTNDFGSTLVLPRVELTPEEEEAGAGDVIVSLSRAPGHSRCPSRRVAS